jgi:hypothetical protein
MAQAQTAAKAPLLKAADQGVHTTEMTVDEWHGVPDNPRQRDTERHLQRATHLKAPSPTHSRVAMAMTADGHRWKLDGHTRALGWVRQMIPIPDRLVVSVYLVKDEAEACELYTHFDAQQAVETGYDKVYGAYRQLNFAPRSLLLKAGQISSAVKLAQGCYEGQRYASKEPIYDLMKLWQKELKLFDEVNPNKMRFRAPLITAALMTFRKHSEEPTEFWRLYNDDAGEKIENAMDPVEALSRFIMGSRGDNRQKAAAGTYDVIGKGIAAYEAHRASRTYTRNLVAQDPARYFVEGAR